MLTKDQLTPYILGHLGLVGTYIQEAGIIENIDSLIPKKSNNPSHLTHGQVVALMVLNGVGYTTRPLYMTHNFFEAKDVEAMLGIKFETEWLNDDVIGRTMDELYNYGLTPLFSELSLNMLKGLGRKIGSVNIDSTSFHYHGRQQKYTDDNSQDDDKKKENEVDSSVPHKINVTYGYSRDAHPELVQLMEQMMVDNATGIPLYMEPENGNTNDTQAFGRMVKVFKSFKEYTYDGYIYLCGDSALYSEGNIAGMQESGIKFVTRVADGKLKSAQLFIEAHRDDELEPIDEVNQGKTYLVEDCGVQQVWLLVHSNAAEARSNHSVDSAAEKEKIALNKKLKEYGKTYFSCEPDAEKEMKKFSDMCRYCKIASSSIVKEEVPKKGRKPKVERPESEKTYRYKISITIDIDEEYCNVVKRNRSYFIVATNDVKREWQPDELLKQYKSQNKVERGFRFLKDPEFFADSIFVSKNERIQALFMIMTLGLAIFSALDWKLRNAMKEGNVKLKNQIGKLTDRITMRYVFQIFNPVITVILESGERLIYHVSPKAHQILDLLGSKYRSIYI